jgi:signal peptidase I
MTGDSQNENAPVRAYQPWVGVVLSLFVSGAAHFLAGQKLAGVRWFSAILFSGLVAVWCLASTLIPGDLPGLFAWIVGMTLWIVMLVKSYRPVPRLKFSAWCGYILSAALIHLFLFDGIHVFFRPFTMPTGSMSPTIHGKSRQSDGTTNNGDHLFVEMYAYWFKPPCRGDVIAFKTKGLSPLLPGDQIYLKRIAGIPGDTLSVRNGHLFNGDRQITEPPALAKLVVINPPVSQPYLANSNDIFKVPDGRYFVIGDNTGNSFDSRFWGTVPKTNIIGKASKIYWPLNHVGNVQ